MFFHCNSSEFSANIRSIATANEETLLWKTLLPDLLPYIFSHLYTHPRFVSGNCFCLSVPWKFSETFCFRMLLLRAQSEQYFLLCARGIKVLPCCVVWHKLFCSCSIKTGKYTHFITVKEKRNTICGTFGRGLGCQCFSCFIDTNVF